MQSTFFFLLLTLITLVDSVKIADKATLNAEAPYT